MTQVKESWKAKGYVDEAVPQGVDLKAEIRRMCQEKNAIILAHYYTEGVLQDIADFVGDSLALAQKAATTEADIIVMCGVHFMGETNKILCPQKKVLIPDLNATCSLAESCPAEKFAAFVKEHPGHKVVSYVNTSAATKAIRRTNVSLRIGVPPLTTNRRIGGSIHRISIACFFSHIQKSRPCVSLL